MRGITRRKGSEVWYGRFYIPSDLWRERGRLIELGADRIGKNQSWEASTGQRDKKAAEEAYEAQKRTHERRMVEWRHLLAHGPLRLTHQQVVSIAGTAALEFVRQHEKDPDQLPTPRRLFNFAFALLRGSPLMPQVYMGDPVEDFRREIDGMPLMAIPAFVEAERANKPGPWRSLCLEFADSLLKATSAHCIRQMVDAEMAQSGLSVDQTSAVKLESFVTGRAADNATLSLSARLEGDYTPKQWEDGVRPFSAPAVTSPQQTGRVTLFRLFDLWKRDHIANGRALRTTEDYEAKVEDFVKWLGHDDALKITKGDIAAYCDHLRHDLGLSAKTVAGKYLTCIKAIFRAGEDKDLIKENVAAKARHKVPRPIVSRSPGYSDDEARAVLTLASRSLEMDDKRSHMNRLAGRWGPWLCCYTGARIGELMQLRKEDVIEEHGVPCLRITPESGSVKTGVYRLVPIHPHLQELGFLEFVRSRPLGPLFYKPTKNRKNGGNSQAQWTGNAVARWIKAESEGHDPRLQPNHAWRHRFKTVGRDAGIDLHYLNVIQGHSDGTAAADYGETTVKALAREIARIPRLEV